ncbi:hypothetical protein [Abyssibacter sp.]|jgi:hypothetical protein|uniref:hypothetical protein n=1 Tax=Abyssibacter sp. TaxID=2320200 RepID=UPI000C4330D1|nr:hypothetical protein [Abyssibacter sp.]MBB88590.1 hypothetical protein [Xanthomonadales bacterium]MCK5860493.1 hypothetical protein [Abyssibacter sp.]
MRLRLPTAPLLQVLAMTALFGCAGGQSGSEGPVGGEPPADVASGAGLQGCVERAQQSVDRDAMTPMGFTPRQALNLAAGTDRSLLDFSDSTGSTDETGLTLTVTDTGGDVLLVDIEPADDTPSAGCPDYVLIPVSVQFTTDDGRFDESFSANLVAFQANETSFTQRLDADALGGSFEYDSVDMGSYEQRDVLIHAIYDADGSRGRVSGIGRRADDSQTTLVIANWGEGSTGDLQ